MLSVFSAQIRNNNGIRFFEDGNGARDFVFIDDEVNAAILGIEKEEANGNVFNIGVSVFIDVLTVASALSMLVKLKFLTVSGRFRLGYIRHNYADLSKIIKL